MRIVLLGLLLASVPAFADPKPSKPRAAGKHNARPCSVFRTPTLPWIRDLEALELARLHERPPIVDDEPCWFRDASAEPYYRLDLVENLIAQPVVRAKKKR